jgi:hypothetical protein
MLISISFDFDLKLFQVYLLRIVIKSIQQISPQINIV